MFAAIMIHFKSEWTIGWHSICRNSGCGRANSLNGIRICVAPATRIVLFDRQWLRLDESDMNLDCGGLI
jgi:hypothetical protein